MDGRNRERVLCKLVMWKRRRKKSGKGKRETKQRSSSSPRDLDFFPFCLIFALAFFIGEAAKRERLAARDGLTVPEEVVPGERC
jgi:hypothetical protein